MDIRLNDANASVGLSQEALQLVRVQSMFANDSAVQEQDGDIESMTALQGRVAIYVDYVDRREGQRSSERAQLGQHLVAELTVVTMHHCQT